MNDTRTDQWRLLELMRRQGRNVDEMASELARRVRYSPLASYRHVQNLSQEKAVDAYNQRLGVQTGDAGHMTRQRLGKLENWPVSGAAPTLAELLGLAALYGTVPRNLVTPEDLTMLPAPLQAALATVAGDDRAARPAEPEARTPYPPAHLDSVVAAAHETCRLYATWDSATVGAESLAECRRDLERLCRGYLHRPLRPVFAELVLLRDRVFGLLVNHHRIAATTELLVMAAITCSLAARVSDDLGYPEPAERQARMAWLLAQESGHRSVMAWVLATQSGLAYWAGRMAEAVEMASRAARHASTGTIAARVTALRARASARAGDPAEAAAALSEAGRARESSGRDDLDDIGGVLSFPLALQQYLAASTYLWLGDAPAAERESMRAIEAADRDGAGVFHGDLALTRVVLAKARLLRPRRDVLGVVDALAPVLALHNGLRLAGLNGLLTGIADELATPDLHRSSDARRLRRDISHFVAQLPSAPRAARRSCHGTGDLRPGTAN
jgi:hypothetical protein